MSLAPHQLVIAALEIGMLLTGAWLIARALGVADYRARLLDRSRLAHWELAGFEVTLLVLAIFLCGLIGQGVGHHYFADTIKQSPQRAGLEVVVYGLGFHGAALLGWPLFWLVRRMLHADYGAPPPPVLETRREPLAKILVHALSTVVIALPALALISAAWNLVLRTAGLPDDPQDLLAVFGHVHSKPLLGAMLFVACVLAPINEELLFRGAIFRFCRQRFGRAPALLVSGVLFGALHGNWAGFVPLAMLGAVLALAYERTGDIRVSMIAHGLFNLNTLIVVLSGLDS
ncbi:lysostaphin resistance A-like protein [Oleiharenicola sp. Vm1]|uniref:CPBP family intramembrane glutamic endopeptidase n=1 Tax=Oleiharenicola sp. Vm1 TaxID=3398393 RepID=UPI0039F4810E